jgi:hypothetical protein
VRCGAQEFKAACTLQRMFFKHLERRERLLGEKYNEGLRREKEGGLGRCPKRPLVFAPEGRMKLVYNTMPEEPYLDELNARHIPPMLQLSSVRAPWSSTLHPFGLQTEEHPSPSPAASTSPSQAPVAVILSSRQGHDALSSRHA